MELQDHVQSYADAGISIVALTYDAPDLQQEFIDRNSISYPLLSDVDATTIKALGILNESYEPGEPAYGIPHPGVFVLNPDGEIVGKIFVENFRIRVDGENTLAYARQLLD